MPRPRKWAPRMMRPCCTVAMPAARCSTVIYKPLKLLMRTVLQHGLRTVRMVIGKRLISLLRTVAARCAPQTPIPPMRYAGAQTAPQAHGRKGPPIPPSFFTRVKFVGASRLGRAVRRSRDRGISLCSTRLQPIRCSPRRTGSLL